MIRVPGAAAAGRAVHRKVAEELRARHLRGVLMAALPQKDGARLRVVLAGMALGAVLVAAGLLLGETALRVSGFEYHLMSTVQFGWPDPQTLKADYAVDADLLWVTKDYQQKLDDARRTHPNVIFMGDSYTERGDYPARAMTTLSLDDRGRPTGMHVAAGGWTSEQGVAQMRRDIIGLHPQIVVVCYGWSDHAIALGPTDVQLRHARRWLWLAEHSRLAQAGLRAWVGDARVGGASPLRVPPDAYVRNLEQIARLARRAGITPVFVTAPSSDVAGRVPVSLQQGREDRLPDVASLHEQYVGLTKAAATAERAYLCDAFGVFNMLRDRHDLFRPDGMHLTPQGDMALGRVVGGCITQAMSHRF